MRRVFQQPRHEALIPVVGMVQPFFRIAVEYGRRKPGPAGFPCSQILRYSGRLFPVPGLEPCGSLHIRPHQEAVGLYHVIGTGKAQAIVSIENAQQKLLHLVERKAQRMPQVKRLLPRQPCFIHLSGKPLCL